MHTSYSDVAIAPVSSQDLDLFKDTAGGAAAVEKQKRADELRVQVQAKRARKAEPTPPPAADEPSPGLVAAE